MATFSTNQVKHLYVAKALDASLDTVGDIKFSTAGDNQISAKYVGRDGVVRTDLIDLATLKGKAVKAASMAQYLESAYVACGTVVAGQQYILKVIIDEFGGISPEDKGFIFAEYTAGANDAAKNVLAGLAVSLAKNAKKAAYNPLIKVYVTTAATGSVAAGNSTEVTASTNIATLSGNYAGLVIEAAEQPWVLGKMQFEMLHFNVATDKIVSSGIETAWATVTRNADHVTAAITNNKKIADLEYFCAGERGDIYRGMGYPNNFEFAPLVGSSDIGTDTYGYDVIELTWAYQGDAEDIQKSPKELIVAIPAPASYGSGTESYKILADINTAAGSTVVDQVFGS